MAIWNVHCATAAFPHCERWNSIWNSSIWDLEYALCCCSVLIQSKRSTICLLAPTLLCWSDLWCSSKLYDYSIVVGLTGESHSVACIICYMEACFGRLVIWDIKIKVGERLCSPNFPRVKRFGIFHCYALCEIAYTGLVFTGDVSIVKRHFYCQQLFIENIFAFC